MDRRGVRLLLEQRVLVPSTEPPCPLACLDSTRKLNLIVVYSSFNATLAVLRKVNLLVKGLDAHIDLVAPQPVPFPNPLEKPPVQLEFVRRRLEQVAQESAMETAVHHYLCRDRLAVLAAVLKPRSIVFIGGAKRWWPTPEMRLARRLSRSGHEVIFIPVR